nr:unnamed protein product [Digitaria exilis]
MGGELGRRPEELFNHYVSLWTATRNIVGALGFLVLFWSTVVLLGGFVGLLRVKEFWVLTALSFLMAFSFILLVNISPLVIVGISVWRLVQRDYGDADGDPGNRAKLTAALDIFYALTLFQGLFSLYHVALIWKWGRYLLSKSSVAKYCELGVEEWGYEVARMYLRETKRKFSKEGVVPDNWNLIAYGVEFLQSASGDDRLWGARVLDLDLVYGKDKSVVTQNLLFSRLSIMNLIGMIGLRGKDDTEKRERAARIVAHLASDLSIKHFPGTLQCICSLLESSKQSCDQKLPDEKDQNGSLNTSQQHQDDAVMLMVNDEHEQDSSLCDWLLANIKRTTLYVIQQDMEDSVKVRRYSYTSKGAKDLISQGLLILEKLTEDEGNCTEISRHQRLMSKITSPLSSHDFLSIVQDSTMFQMISSLLTVVSRILTSYGDGTTRLRQELASNTEVVSNLMGILDTDSEGAQELHGRALEILTELAFNDYFTKLTFGDPEPKFMLNKLFETVQCIFLDRERAIRLRGQAGEALARLLTLRKATARGANVSDILSKKDAINLFNKVLDHILSSKMGTAAGGSNSNVAENISDTEQCEERKLISALLSVAVVMCNENVISKKDFAHANTEDTALVKKLKEVLESNKHSTAECLRVVKLTCQLVIAMIQAKPSCIQLFDEQNFKEALTEALDTMSEIDSCMLFAGNGYDREGIKPARSLAPLVKEAQQLLQS